MYSAKSIAPVLLLSIWLLAVPCWSVQPQPIEIGLSSPQSSSLSVSSFQLQVEVTSAFECSAMAIRIDVPPGLSVGGRTEWTAVTGPDRPFSAIVDIGVLSPGSWRLQVWAETLAPARNEQVKKAA